MAAGDDPTDGGATGGDPTGGRSGAVVAYLTPRARLLATAGAVGVVVGCAGALALAVRFDDAAFAASQVFAFGALVLGFALLGWSGSVFAGRGIEAMQTYMETGTGWTEADSRRAMARIGGFGAGVMVGTAVLDVLVA